MQTRKYQILATAPGVAGAIPFLANLGQVYESYEKAIKAIKSNERRYDYLSFHIIAAHSVKVIYGYQILALPNYDYDYIEDELPYFVESGKIFSKEDAEMTRANKMAERGCNDVNYIIVPAGAIKPTSIFSKP